MEAKRAYSEEEIQKIIRTNNIKSSKKAQRAKEVNADFKLKRDYSNLFFVLKEIIVFCFVIFFFYNANAWRTDIYSYELTKAVQMNTQIDPLFNWRTLFDFSCLIPFYFMFTNIFMIKVLSLFFPAYGSGISNFKNYRDSKLGIMSNENAKNEYMKTAWVDSLDNGGKNTKATKEYINSRLSSMSNETGYKYLKGEK